MGNEVSVAFKSANLPHKFFQKKKRYRKILILSLDAAGKTTLLYRIKTGNVINTIPTIGYNHETIQYKSSNFDFWDIGGQDGIRKMWKLYFENVQGVVFLVDSNDRERIEEAKSELHRIEQLLLAHDRAKAVILIMANKQDLPDAMTHHEIYDKLNLRKLNSSISCELLTCCIKNGTGLAQALEWLHRELKLRF